MDDIPEPKIPAPRLRTVENLTGFSFFGCQKMAAGRVFHDTVVVKGAFELRPDELRPLGRAPIALGDEVWDLAASERSSLKRAGDVLVGKPSTDVFVTGTARAPDDQPAPSWDAAVVVSDRRGQPIVSHALSVTGPRRWEHRAMLGWVLSAPSPVREVPIRYEHAYGGPLSEENPSGVGLYGKLDKDETYTAPQWSLEGQPPKEPNVAVPVAGLGPISRVWSSRRRYAGTYDAAWERRAHAAASAGFPADYPSDFDPRFFQCAPPALITPSHLRGDEPIGLSGLAGGRGDLLTRLPGITVFASLSTRPGAWTDHELPLDTVHLDLDERRAYLSWRLSLDRALGVTAAVLYLGEAK